MLEEQNGAAAGPLKIRFELNSYLLTMLYICYTYNLSMDLVLALYEKYGKDSLFVFKAMACKKSINLNDKQILKFLQESKKLYRHILTRNIILHEYTLGFQTFIKWLSGALDDVYAETVEMKLSYLDLYHSLGKSSKK